MLPLRGAISRRYGVDPYWANVAALLHADGANGGTTFVDSGPNGLTITPSVVTTNTGQFKFGTASARSGAISGATLAFSSGAPFDVTTGDFTIECFLRLNSTGLQQTIYVSKGASWDSHTLLFFLSGNKLSVTMQGGGGVLGATSLTTATWYHVAATRAGTSLKVFLNGTQDGSATDSTNFAVSSPLIGQNDAAVGSTQQDWWIDEWRFTRGVARYTGSFAPPAAPFSA